MTKVCHSLLALSKYTRPLSRPWNEGSPRPQGQLVLPLGRAKLINRDTRALSAICKGLRCLCTARPFAFYSDADKKPRAGFFFLLDWEHYPLLSAWLSPFLFATRFLYIAEVL